MLCRIRALPRLDYTTLIRLREIERMRSPEWKRKTSRENGRTLARFGERVIGSWKIGHKPERLAAEYAIGFNTVKRHIKH